MELNGSTGLRSLKDVEPKSVGDIRIISNLNPVSIALSSEKENDILLPKLKKKTLASVYLKYFDTAPNGKSRRCKFCGQTYSIATATGNLGRHLGTRHPGYENSEDSIPIRAPHLSTALSKKNPPENKTTKLDLDHLNWLLIKWLTLSSLPPTILEETWLHKSFKLANPSIEIWSCQKFQGALREVCRSMQGDIKITLDQVTSKVAITLEFWTSYEQIYYMSITCQWIDDTWTFQKVLLDICRIPYPCGGTEIYHALVEVLKVYNIDDRVLACTHDNSQSAMQACHKLKEDMDCQKVGPFCYIPCAARTLNMIIEDGLRTIKPIIFKARELVIEMNASTTIMEDFMELTVANQEGIWKFPLEVSARWNGQYQTLDVIRKASKSIDGIIRKHDHTLGSKMLLSSSERNAVNIMHGYLEPFYKTTNNLCSSKLPTVGLILFFMDHISEMLSACKDSSHYPDWLKSSAKEMNIKSSNYHDQVFNTFTFMTAVLDPRIKVELIPDSLNSKSNLEESRSHFLRDYCFSHFSSMSNVCGPHDTEQGDSVSFAEEIARKKRRTTVSVATDELTQYLSEPPAPIPTDVLEWWKVNSGRYPRLSLMARDFLSVQATSVPPEEVFCSKGDEIDKKRFGLSCSTTRDLLCVKLWVEAGFKLKYESSEIDCDRLMEMAAEMAGQHYKSGSDKK